MGTPVDLVGKVFSRLTVIALCPIKSAKRRWLCRCECGKTTTVSGSNLVAGEVRSCGCLRSETAKATMTTHGLSHGGDNRYDVWETMRKRCNNPNFKDWKYYGAKGIRVCDRWDSFTAFCEDIGERPSMRHTLDRRDSSGNYEPSNCRWATGREQALNRAGHSRWIPVTIFGVAYPSISRAAASLNISQSSVLKLNERSAEHRHQWALQHDEGVR